MGSSKKRQPAPPPVPSPEHIAQTDADFNRIDQITPLGSLTFSGDRNNVATLELSPEQQELLDQRTSLDSGLLSAAGNAVPGINDLIGSPLSTSSVGPQFDLGDNPELSNVGNPDQFRDDVSNAFFDRTSGLLNRQFDRQQEQLDQKLANQGIQAGSEAFSQSQGDLAIQQNDAFSRLANDATIFGGQEASRAFSDDLSATGFNNANAIQDFQNTAFQQDRSNAARSTLFNEEAATRGNQFNELASLLGLQQTQAPQLNSFFGPAQANVGDAFGLQQAGLQNNFTNQSRAASAAKGGAGGLLGNLGAAYLGNK